jgi:hypothetical protein
LLRTISIDRYPSFDVCNPQIAKGDGDAPVAVRRLGEAGERVARREDVSARDESDDHAD